MLVSDALDCVTGREKELERKFDFLLRVFTPRTVFMEVGSADCGLALRAATYVERVWCIDAAGRVTRSPSNLRLGGMSAIDTESVDVAFSERLNNPEEIGRVLAPGGVYFIYGQLMPAQLFREAGFSRVAYYAGGVRVPAAVAKISRITTTAAYK
jgi:hypothetical protein